ncbi:CDP-glycerol glycerophosphotransferase family protein [Fusobacterium gastrosuis]|uniref:CDP-glycerol glycerophosphotransferase family protein n=1 Tax=Fusobacterium gastrosuis TaxID=1755100 RepID=UPI0029725F87|nr:CDP-glycerol glycerophosphotransferase family protein [Fusobacteriaceae bacterium]MDY5712905.1 CDP-glycerol glycerophosphotransferase family protein [Fusobacterium gastrosuis]
MKNNRKFFYVRLINFVKGFLLSLIFIPLPKKKSRIIFSSTGNIKYDHNSKYLFEYFLKNYSKFEIKYVVNDKKLKKELEKKLGNHFISTDNMKEILYCLFSYTWIVSSLETPVGGTLQRINRLVIHLGHGTPLKNIGLLEKKISFIKKIYYFFIRSNFSYVLATSENFKGIMSNFLSIPLERILVEGQPRNDSVFLEKRPFLEKNFKISKNSKSILYAPTWRPNKETAIFPLVDIQLDELSDYLYKNNINIFLRVHPDFEEKIDDKIVNLDRVYILDSKKVGDISEYLSCFDLLITDYSSIFIDFLLLQKPIIFLPYDYEEYKREIGFTVDYYTHTPGPKILLFSNFLKEISKLLNNKNYYFIERQRENRFFNICLDNTNCKKMSEFIMKKIGGLV